MINLMGGLFAFYWAAFFATRNVYVLGPGGINAVAWRGRCCSRNFVVKDQDTQKKTDTRPMYLCCVLFGKQGLRGGAGRQANRHTNTGKYVYSTRTHANVARLQADIAGLAENKKYRSITGTILHEYLVSYKKSTAISCSVDASCHPLPAATAVLSVVV